MSTDPKGLTNRWYDAVSTLEFEIAKGNIRGHEPYRKFGQNFNITAGAANSADIWTPGGLYVFPTAAETLDVIVTDAGDIGNVHIFGLGNLWEEQEDIVAVNGIGTYVSTKTFRRVNRAYIAGNTWAGDHNTDAINIDNTASAERLGQIPALKGQTQQLVYTVPLGHTLFDVSIDVWSVRTAGGQLPVIEFDFWKRAPDDAWRSVFNLHIDASVEVSAHGDKLVGEPIFEKSDIRLEAETDQNNTHVHAIHTGYLIDNTELPNLT